MHKIKTVLATCALLLSPVIAEAGFCGKSKKYSGYPMMPRYASPYPMWQPRLPYPVNGQYPVMMVSYFYPSVPAYYPSAQGVKKQPVPRIEPTKIIKN